VQTDDGAFFAKGKYFLSERKCLVLHESFDKSIRNNQNYNGISGEVSTQQHACVTLELKDK
jgi:hypothetical protein